MDRWTCIIDANVISAFAKPSEHESRGKTLRELLPYATDVSFCIAAGGISELTIGLDNGQIALDDWIAAVPFLVELIDPDFPVMFHEAGPFAVRPPPDGVTARAYFRCAWKLMTKHLARDKDLERLRRGVVLNVADGPHRIWSDPACHRRVVEEGRAAWVSYIENVGDKVDTKAMSESEIVGVLKRSLEAKHGPIADDYDALHRVVANLLKQRGRKHTPYNPASDKRAGDFPDMTMLTYLSRASICTFDHPLINRVEQTRTPQANCVFTLEDLVAHLRSPAWRDESTNVS